MTILRANPSEFGIVILDEAHRQSEAQAQLIIECRLRTIPVVLLSGTFPDGVIAGALYDMTAFGCTVRDLPGAWVLTDFLRAYGRNAVVFCPSINDCTDKTERSQLYCVGSTVHSLHGRMDPEAQKRVIKAEGPKTVFATKIAQEALTIKDIENVYASDNSRTITVTEATQQRGRAGRVTAGVFATEQKPVDKHYRDMDKSLCYRLALYSEVELALLPEGWQPEFRNLELARDVLVDLGVTGNL
eukprot:6240427-Amphidinium_carterae.1